MSASDALAEAAVRNRKRRDTRRLLSSLSGQAVVVVACLAIAAPCYFLFLGSFKSVEEFFSAPFALPESFGLTNYERAWEEAAISTALFNSVVVTVASVVLGTAVACLASYSIACLRFRRASLVQIIFVSGLFVPVQVISLAFFIEMRQLGLLGTLWPLIIIYATLGLPLGVVVLVGFFRSIPRELSEAAAIDGASPWRIFWDIILPLSRAPIMTVAILNGVWIWNDFYFPLVFSAKSDIQTLPVAVLNFFGTYSTEYGLIFAGVTISAIPVLVVYALMTRRFVEGVTAGAVKG